VRILWAAIAAVAVLAIVSMAFNILLVIRLLALRNDVSATLDAASKAIDDLEARGIAITLPFSQTIDFEGDIPFKQEIQFPFKGNVPFNSVVRVPVTIGPITQIIEVPVNTVVPVDVVVPVKVDQVFHVKTQVPVNISVPISLGPEEPLLKDMITQARQWIERMRKYLM